jgi:RNA polymerase I-specific transcription initiation factor RRN7
MGTSTRIRGEVWRVLFSIDFWSSGTQILCRDIWALHLSLLPEPPPEFDSHEPGDDSAEGDGGHKVKEAKQTPIDEHSDVGGNKEADATAGSSSEGDEDPELAELMRENSELSSSSSDEGEGDPATRAALSTVRKASSARVTMRYQKPSSAIAVLMLACWMMRVPVLYRDFIRWVSYL